MLKYVFLGLFIAVMVLVGIISRKSAKRSGFSLAAGIWGHGFRHSHMAPRIFQPSFSLVMQAKIGWGFGISSTFIGIGNALLGSLLAWLVLAKRTRRMTHQLGASTMPEFFESAMTAKL